ncbi:MAG: OB-fold domain-containing protein [Pseudomonadota bacterium]|nr:OB-fold domain-containing protein [Pseudomonadota bacterium]
MSEFYLPSGLPAPVAANDGLDAPYWEGLRAHQLIVQRCNSCHRHQWGPEWICHHCNSLDLGWSEVKGEAVLYSYQKIWHPVHPALKEATPYLVVLVQLPGADDIRMVGNLLGDPNQDVPIGARVEVVFEDHPDGEHPFTLAQWRLK